MKRDYAKQHIQTWNKVWEKDIYASPEIRKEKAERKVKLLFEMLPIEINKNSLILDAGCGGGYISEYLLAHTDARVIAFDQSEIALNICNRINEDHRIKTVCCDALEIPFEDECADLAVCIGLLEHVREYDRCIEEIKRILKKDGFFYVVSSNKYSSMYFQWVVRHKFHLWRYGYQKNWTPRQFAEIMEKHLFRQIDIKVIEGWGDHSSLSFIDRIIRKKTKNFGRYIVYLGQKK